MSNVFDPARKPSKQEMDGWWSIWNAYSSDQKETIREEKRELCNKFMKSDAYNDSETLGYQLCCDMYGFCGGLSGWWIFFIIVIVIGCLAAAGAAFWFFYLKRKMGGRDEKEGIETGEDTTASNSIKSGDEISVGTY